MRPRLLWAVARSAGFQAPVGNVPWPHRTGPEPSRRCQGPRGPTLCWAQVPPIFDSAANASSSRPWLTKARARTLCMRQRWDAFPVPCGSKIRPRRADLVQPRPHRDRSLPRWSRACSRMPSENVAWPPGPALARQREAQQAVAHRLPRKTRQGMCHPGSRCRAKRMSDARHTPSEVSGQCRRPAHCPTTPQPAPACVGHGPGDSNIQSDLGQIREAVGHGLNAPAKLYICHWPASAFPTYHSQPTSTYGHRRQSFRTPEWRCITAPPPRR